MGIFTKAKQAEEIQPFTDAQLQAVIEILSEIGLNLDFGFDHHAQNPESYEFGNMLEWSERGHGLRYYIYVDFATRKVSHINVANLGYEVLTKEEIARYEERLAEAIARFA